MILKRLLQFDWHLHQAAVSDHPRATISLALRHFVISSSLMHMHYDVWECLHHSLAMQRCLNLDSKNHISIGGLGFVFRPGGIGTAQAAGRMLMIA